MTSKRLATMAQTSIAKKLLLISLATAALTLGACADPDSATTQDDVDPGADPQTQVEQEATGVDDVEQATENVNSADISDEPLVDDTVVTDDVAVVSDDDGTVTEGVNNAEVLDGSESEEHVSTY